MSDESDKLPRTEERRVLVALGSNLEPRQDYLRRAIAALSDLPGTRFDRASSVIETEPVDVPPQFAALKFLNQVAVFYSTLEPLDFSRRMHGIEDALGRVRTVRNGPRTIDLDLIDFGGLSIETPELTLPHPRAAERDFVLRPLAELGIALSDTVGPYRIVCLLGAGGMGKVYESGIDAATGSYWYLAPEVRRGEGATPA